MTLSENTPDDDPAELADREWFDNLSAEQIEELFRTSEHVEVRFTLPAGPVRHRMGRSVPLEGHPMTDDANTPPESHTETLEEG